MRRRQAEGSQAAAWLYTSMEARTFGIPARHAQDDASTGAQSRKSAISAEQDHEAVAHQRWPIAAAGRTCTIALPTSGAVLPRW